MKSLFKLVCVSVLVFSSLLIGCSDDEAGGTPQLTAFEIPSLSIQGTISETDHTVGGQAPYTADVSALVATFKTTKETIVTVNGVVQESGKTPNDFSQPIVYQLSIKDGETVQYTVTLQIAEAEDNDEHNAMLKNLGVETELGQRKDPDGNDVREDYNPLNRKISTVFKLNELYVTGLTVNDVQENLMDDKAATYANLLTKEGDYAWTKNPKVSAAGDLDADGFDEVAVLLLNTNTWALELRLIEDASDNYMTTVYTVVDLEDLSDLFKETYDKYWKLDIAVADVDEDPEKEILITANDTLYVLDDPKQEFKIIDSKTYSGATKDQFVRVAAGDLDMDGKDEFVVTDGQWDASGTAEYYIYDQKVETELKSGQVSAEVDGVNRVLFTADVQIGDFDGDRLPEIAFIGDFGGDHNTGILIMDDAKKTTPFQFLPVFQEDGNEGDERLPATAVTDLNGDRVNELVVEEDIWALDGGAFAQPYGKDPLPRIHYSLITVGDITGDYLDDIILFKENWEDGIFIYGLDSTHAFVQLDRIQNVKEGTFTTLTVVNADADSAVVEFQQTELLFTEPRIIAAMSCPPYHATAGQDNNDTGTTFGKSKGQEVVTEQSVGFSVGFSFGYEWEAPFGVAKASFKTTVENSFDWTASKSTQIETSIAYSSGPNEDKIVFSTIPFDVYYYKVLSSPDSTQVGSTLTINVPRKPQVLSVDREFYNKFNGNSPDITPEVMGHAIGDVHSYPNKAKKDELVKNGGLQSDLASVGAGSGYVTLGISKSEGEGQGTSFDMSVTFEAEFGAGGVTAGVSAGFHYGYGYEVTNTESTFYEGMVGDIPSENYTGELMYQFGLFTYEKSYRGQRFVMVDYWVE